MSRDMTPDRAPDVAPLIVREGRLLAYRLLDVADEIDLLTVETKVQGGATRRGALKGEGARSLVISAPPLELALGRTAVALPRSRAKLDAEVSAHLFDYGAVRSEEHTSELQSHVNLVCRLLLEKK